MSKYRNLTFYLAGLDQGVWGPSFAEIEDVLGCPLPASARQHAAWWANQARGQSLAWQSAGWNTNSVNLAQERVTFLYKGGSEEDATTVPPLTISDAKAGLAAHFGVPPEAIEIIIRG